MTTTTDNITADAAGLALPDGIWDVDLEQSELGFAVKVLGWLTTVRGTFRAFDGILNVRAGNASGELLVAADSLDTHNKRRDRHLRSADFFDVERHPRAVFTATSVAPQDGALTVTGVLSIGAARLGLEVPVSVEQTDDGAVRLEGKTVIAREPLGLSWNCLRTVGPDAALHARLTLRRAAR